MGLLKGDTQPTTSGTSSVGGGFNAILDRGSEFDGKLTFEGTVRIDGKFKGEILSEANLVIGESGKVEADITVGSISVSGEVTGNITARTKIELHAPAMVKGNLHTSSLVIEDGVTFEGSCVMEKTGARSQKGLKGKQDSVPGDGSEAKRGADLHP
jgi:cytoskeletal protein CcmA (bactofilin family)